MMSGRHPGRHGSAAPARPVAARPVRTDGKVDLDILVTGRFTLAEAEEALKAGRQAGQLKAIVYPGR